ncbi:DUF4132 domain-containing protein [Tessaracoccus caeni]|uniref:DUF4132 domain-containing protein n=1 Tax=Tessaracoccus caeni TaxID=3031239 RepID=UPI0023DCCA69|nr:DUF4132 domain-containing protein [Tessaracoccus caeni]MDF1488946.1 DUF4132 domain-containing protein [Tessaracoccus caeni]
MSMVAQPSHELREALRPLAGHSDDLYQRCVAFVHDGTDPMVLHEVGVVTKPRLWSLLGYPGSMQGGRWAWVGTSTRRALKKVGVKPKGRSKRRRRYYATRPSPDELVRYARLVCAMMDDVERQAPGVPLWLTVLINDVVIAVPHQVRDTESLAQTLPGWDASLMTELLVADGCTRDEAELLALVALIQRPADGYGYSHPSPGDLPGVSKLLTTRGLAAKEVARLSASTRIWVLERAASEPEVGNALAATVAELTVDAAKGPRRAALQALRVLPADVRAEVIAPVLGRIAPRRAEDLVELLATLPGGPELLADAVDGGAKIGVLVDKAGVRRDAIEAEQVPDHLVLPPYDMPTEVPATDEVIAELRAALAQEIEEWEAPPERSAHGWLMTFGKKEYQKDKKKALAEARRITETDLADVVRAANGKGTASRVLKTYGLSWIAEAAPSLNLIHLLRLELLDPEPELLYVSGGSEPEDLRTREHLIRLVGGHADQIGAKGVSVDDFAEHALRRPELVSWPWFAGHLEILERWLMGDTNDVANALRLLEWFPRLPPSLVPLVARVAVSESRLNHPVAQRLLSDHPAALGLAVQALADGKGEIRVGAAGWIAAQHTWAGIEPLQAALAKEKRPPVQAALLSALEILGDDISVHLAPDTLHGEAVRGLKAKLPASMSWLNLDLLPTVRWSNGTPADPLVLRWWFVLAVKVRNPDGSGLFDRYLSLLHPDDAADVGRFALRAWIARDTQHPDEADSHAYADAEGTLWWKGVQQYARDLRKVSGIDPDALREAEADADRPLEQFVARAFREHQATYVGSAIADKGLLALTTRMPDVELAAAVQSYIRAHGARRAQVEALVHALFANGDPAALQLLLSIARRFGQVTVQKKAKELVERLADERGWTTEELADRTIPAAGFADDGMLHLSYGPREFLGRVNTGFGIDLSHSDGTPLKALPAPRVSDDAEAAAEAKKQLSASRKELKAVLTLQAARLHDAMCAGRGWPTSDWLAFIVGHPLMGQLATRLVWMEVGDGAIRTFRPTEDGELIDADDQVVVLAESAEVRLAHCVVVGDAEAERWAEHLRDYQVTPLFDQFSATPPAYPDDAVELSDLQGHVTDTFSFRAVAAKRGYRRGGDEGSGWFTGYTKGFSSAGLVAMIEFTGANVPEENMPCATESLYFLRGEQSEQKVPLREVPPVMLAECYADYAAFAALGPFDPDYWKR